MSNKRATVIFATSLIFVLSACTSTSSDPMVPPEDSATKAVPSPAPTVFEQNLQSDVRGARALVVPSENASGSKLRADNIGISFESTTLADPRLDPDSSNLDDILESIGSPALRFGGNALDRRTFWTSKGENPKKSEQVAVTPADLKRLKRLVDVTDSTVTLGIPLGTYDPKRGADMAANAYDILGSSLVGLAIGNEPNGYTEMDVPDGAVRGGSWNKEKYVEQVEAYADAIHAKRPDAPIIGPDAYDGAWMKSFADSEVKHKAAVSQHWYQLYECGSNQVPGRGPQAENLVQPLAKKSAKKNLSIGKDWANSADLPLWLEETGPTSCPGTNDTSLTNASALWAADFTLYAAQLGVERMTMHSMLGACEGGAPMSLVCDPADHGHHSDAFVPRPNMLGLRLVVPSVGGTFTETSVKGGGNMSAYTVSKDGGRTLVTTVVNANDAAKVVGNPLALRLPNGYSVNEASQVYGPSNDAKDASKTIPSNPLPKELPFSVQTSSPSASAGARELNIDLAASSATVFIMRKK
ncbi:hypothetical protein [Brevibacterium zhoupengii]|uniref:hypothetical protein n=1 Tax=Brevibacterium zhoupengii TaxID=2898795 RepID=UPI001F09AD58|nr:hypothetical protein [Brevibacterium zhoupengii]